MGLVCMSRFALIKIVTLLGLILVALIITAGGVPTSDPSEYPIGFRCPSISPLSLSFVRADKVGEQIGTKCRSNSRTGSQARLEGSCPSGLVRPPPPLPLSPSLPR